MFFRFFKAPCTKKKIKRKKKLITSHAKHKCTKCWLELRIGGDVLWLAALAASPTAAGLIRASADSFMTSRHHASIKGALLLLLSSTNAFNLRPINSLLQESWSYSIHCPLLSSPRALVSNVLAWDSLHMIKSSPVFSIPLDHRYLTRA